MATTWSEHALTHPRLLPALVMAACLAALGTAYASQVWGGLAPCVLCIWQRYAYGAALVAGVVGVLFGASPLWRRWSLALAGLAFLAGAGIALFHVGVEQQWWRGTTACEAPIFDPSLSVEQLRERLLNQPVVRCEDVPWSLFGLSIAGYNVIASLLLAAVSLAAAGATRETRQP